MKTVTKKRKFISAENIDFLAMVKENGGPPTHIAMHPAMIKSIGCDTESPATPLLGIPIHSTELVTDWWPLWVPEAMENQQPRFSYGGIKNFGERK